MFQASMESESCIWALQTFRPPLSLITKYLTSPDPGEVVAAAKALAQRFSQGEDEPTALAHAVPRKALLSMPVDAQTILADLAVAGFPLEIPAHPHDLPPVLACRYRCAEILAVPERLSLDVASVFDLRAVADAPIERVIASGLLQRIAKHARPAMHDVAIVMIRAGLSQALLSPAEAETALWDITLRSSEAVVARALDLAAEPWSQGRPCPSLASWLRGQESARAAVRLAVARNDVAWVRRFATDESVIRSARLAAIVALGALGDASDINFLIALTAEDSTTLAPEALEALRTLKRRGNSPNESQAQRIIDNALSCTGLSLESAAECTSSRADSLIAAIDTHLEHDGPKARCARLLALLGTRKTITRLMEMAGNTSDPVLARFAILELGKIEERSAESVILSKLEAEPEVCSYALGRIGGIATVTHLRALLNAPPRPWLSAVLRVLFRLDPSPTVLAAAVEHGAIGTDTLDALQAYASAEQTHTLATIATAPGHPFRASAIVALGRTGGPLAIDPLGGLLADADEIIRDLAKQALSALGQRLQGANSSLACLENADDPGTTLIAEAALRRLRMRTSSAAETALLLDAVVGHNHPHLVRVVRPLLRQDNPEIRKRAIACLAAAGPVCASWILPYLQGDSPLPVVRQALLALGQAAVPGLGAVIAGWIKHTNMNIKKTAAEALGFCREPTTIPTLVDVLAYQDQPGLRGLVEQTLRGLAGPFLRSLLIEKLASLGDLLREELLVSSLGGTFSPDELAALIARRPNLPRALVLHMVASHADKALDLDAAFRRRQIEHAMPEETDVSSHHPLRLGLTRAAAICRGGVLRRRISEAPFFVEVSSDLVASIQAVTQTNAASVALSIAEQRVLSGLLPKLDERTRQHAIALLATTTDPIVLNRVLPFVDLQRELDPRHGPLLVAIVGRSNLDIARSFTLHARPDVRAKAIEVLHVAGAGLISHAAGSARAALIRSWIDAGREDELLAAVEGKDALPLEEVVAQVAERSGVIAAKGFAQRWLDKNPVERAQTLVDLAFLGDVLEPEICELARNHPRGAVRWRALSCLSHHFRVDRTFLRDRLRDEYSGLSETAAQTLVHMGHRVDRSFVLNAWLTGGFRGSFRIPLDDQDKPALEAAIANATSEADQLHMFGPIAALPLATRIPFLLALQTSTHARVSALARDSLRMLPPEYVLAHIEPQLRSGDLSCLELLASKAALPKTLVDIACMSNEPDAWIRFCLRMAGMGILYAGGLSEFIAAWAAESKSPTGLALLARLADWYEEKRARELLRILDTALAGPFRDAILRSILEALREAPPLLISRVLSGWVRPSDTLAIRTLAEAEAEAPGLLSLLDPALRPAIERALETALETADPEKARHLMTYFAGRAENRAERERVLSMLEGQMRSSSRRVRLHAHRLLRSLAPRDRYLRATRSLLGDSDPTTVRLAIRVLAFGGDIEAAALIAEGLSHPHAAVARAAREGLLVLGDAAIAPLMRSRANMRPDRRVTLDVVIDEIRQRSGLT